MMSTRPNIILCICDQLRAFEVGCYGNPVVRTLHIDGLAAEGVRVETAVSNFPVCMAARSVLLSGQYNRRCTGGVGNVSYPGRAGDFMMPEYPETGRPHLREQTLPEALRVLGYTTTAIGKWHIHSWPHDIGFDSYLIPRVHHCHNGQHYTENGGPEFVPDGYSVDFEAGRVEDYLRARQETDQPFFLYYSISPPHNPLRDAPERYLTMYDPAEIPLRPNVDLSTPVERWDYWARVYRWDFRYYSHHLPYTETLPDDYDLRRLIADYYGLTTWVDDAMGRMLRALTATGLERDTIVVFTADHGDNLGSHGLVQKGGPNEESIRIPLIMRVPGLQPRVLDRRVAGLVDIMPTLLDFAGGSPPSHLHGHTLAPALRSEQTETDDGAFIECGHSIALRTPDYLYTLPMNQEHELGDAPRQCYAMADDPYQMRNLADHAADVPVSRNLDARLRAWHAATPWMDTGDRSPAPVHP